MKFDIKKEPEDSKPSDLEIKAEEDESHYVKNAVDHIKTEQQAGRGPFYGSAEDLLVECKKEHNRMLAAGEYGQGATFKSEEDVLIKKEDPHDKGQTFRIAGYDGANDDSNTVSPQTAQNGSTTKPVEASAKPSADSKKKKSKPSRSRLLFSNNEQSPEEIMSSWHGFSFDRAGVEWSEGAIGASVTGVTVDEDTVLDPQN